MYILENGGIQQWLLLGLAINVGLGVGGGRAAEAIWKVCSSLTPEVCPEPWLFPLLAPSFSPPYLAPTPA